MITYTSSLPKNTLDELNTISEKLNVPKNQIILEALSRYFMELEKKVFEESFAKVGNDIEMREMQP